MMHLMACSKTPSQFAQKMIPRPNTLGQMASSKTPAQFAPKLIGTLIVASILTCLLMQTVPSSLEMQTGQEALMPNKVDEQVTPMPGAKNIMRKFEKGSTSPGAAQAAWPSLPKMS